MVGFIADSNGAHAGFVDDGLNFGVLQKKVRVVYQHFQIQN